LKPWTEETKPIHIQGYIVKLTFSELVDLFPRYNRIKLRELFDKFDYDNSNYLDEQEFEMFILEM